MTSVYLVKEKSGNFENCSLWQPCTLPRGWAEGTHRNADWVFVSQKAYCSNDGKTDKSLLGDEIERTDEEIGIKLKVQTSLMPH